MNEYKNMLKRLVNDFVDFEYRLGKYSESRFWSKSPEAHFFEDCAQSIMRHASELASKRQLDINEAEDVIRSYIGS